MKWTIAVISIGCLVSLDGTSLAGERDNFPININIASRVADGQMGSVRASPDAFQVIGCGLGFGGVSPIASCHASDAAGTSIMCTSTDPGIVQVISALTPSSFIEFFWDDAGNCTTVAISTDSAGLPPTP
jgi:hypothetical protein